LLLGLASSASVSGSWPCPSCLCLPLRASISHSFILCRSWPIGNSEIATDDWRAFIAVDGPGQVGQHGRVSVSGRTSSHPVWQSAFGGMTGSGATPRSRHDQIQVYGGGTCVPRVGGTIQMSDTTCGRLLPGGGRDNTVACAECRNLHEADSSDHAPRRYLFLALDALGGRLLAARECFELQGDLGRYERRDACLGGTWRPATDRYVLCAGCGQEYDLTTGRD
jgi:hypothetical protein